MLNGNLISNISNAKFGPLFYFTLNVKSLYNRLQTLIRKLPTDKKGRSDIPSFWVLLKISPFMVCHHNPDVQRAGSIDKGAVSFIQFLGFDL